ncbi:MAG: hypothetical protein K2W96_24695 [Gemmataceae bacterium]|nr:hypothetical protein [Gemmataceae bacterium]
MPDLDEIDTGIGRVRLAAPVVADTPGFRHDLERDYEDRAWVFASLLSLGEMLSGALRSLRRGAFDGIAVSEDMKAKCKELAARWIAVAGDLRQRAEFYLRHLPGEARKAKAFKQGLQEQQAEVKQTLADMLAQRPSMCPAHKPARPAQEAAP